MGSFIVHIYIYIYIYMSRDPKEEDHFGVSLYPAMCSQETVTCEILLRRVWLLKPP